MISFQSGMNSYLNVTIFFGIKSPKYFQKFKKIYMLPDPQRIFCIMLTRTLLEMFLLARVKNIPLDKFEEENGCYFKSNKFQEFFNTLCINFIQNSYFSI